MQGKSWIRLGKSLAHRYKTRPRKGLWDSATLILLGGLSLGTYYGLIVDWRDRNDIRITSVDDSQTAVSPRCLRSLRGTGALPDGHHLWISVESPTGRILFVREAEMHDGKWRADDLTIGGKGDGGTTFTLGVVDVAADTHRMLSTGVITIDDINGETLDPGADLWRFSFKAYPSGADRRDDVSVAVDPSDLRSCDETA
ncbi:hypothetical protein AB0M28_08920 [Streptomyces sp. NPDC051940]|uniref:hypothetical protein n=1 Tax=Streptomyces sp. NPDC051940 TaxID=3155675 RepID=UPI00344503C1